MKLIEGDNILRRLNCPKFIIEIISNSVLFYAPLNIHSPLTTKQYKYFLPSTSNYSIRYQIITNTLSLPPSYFLDDKTLAKNEVSRTVGLELYYQWYNCSDGSKIYRIIKTEIITSDSLDVYLRSLVLSKPQTVKDEYYRTYCILNAALGQTVWCRLKEIPEYKTVLVWPTLMNRFLNVVKSYFKPYIKSSFPPRK
jgi:hypothetical protein